MKGRDEKLGKFITAMNNDEANIFLIEELASIREQHNLEREEDRWMEVENGSVKRLPVKKVLAKTHDGIIELKEDFVEMKKDTQVLRDFAGFFGFMRKYKGWYVLAFLISLFFSHNVWQPFLLSFIEKL